MPILSRAPRCRSWRRARSRSVPRLFGWLAAISLLVHGWLPVVLQGYLAADHAAYRLAEAGPDLRRSGHGQECPVFHDPICLCAIFVTFLMPASAPVPAPGIVRSARRRRFKSRPRRHRRGALFEARAPPRLP